MIETITLLYWLALLRAGHFFLLVLKYGYNKKQKQVIHAILSNTFEASTKGTTTNAEEWSCVHSEENQAS